MTFPFFALSRADALRVMDAIERGKGRGEGGGGQEKVRYYVVCASLIHSSMFRVCGLRVGSIPASPRRSMPLSISPIVFLSILRFWLNAAFVSTKSSSIVFGSALGLGKHSMWSTAESTFGGGMNAPGWTMRTTLGVPKRETRMVRRP